MLHHAEHGSEIPRYQQIALEIAARIACEEYREGEKIYARSSIAGQYNVSPETARRAIAVLCDLEIAAAEKGSGVTILSREKAADLVERFKTRKTFDSIRKNLLESVARQQDDLHTLHRQLSELIDASQQLRSMNPFMPFRVEITAACVHRGKNIAEIRFWQNTGATIVAVDRRGVVMKSPGPYVTLQEGDVVYFLPQEDTSEQVRRFLYPPDAKGRAAAPK